MQDEEKLTKKQKRELAKEQKRELQERQEKQGKLVKWGAVVAVVAVLGFLGYRFINWLNTPSTVTPTESKIFDMTVTENDHVKGNADATTVLFEYGDYQCPACAQIYPIVESILEEHGENLKFVYRHLPLTNLHEHALSTAYAAEAAGRQGKFWEMHAKLYENQNEWSQASNAEEIFERYATELELDLEQFKADVEDQILQDKVTNDQASANVLRLQSTPSFILNGRPVVLTNNINDFRQEIADQIASDTSAGETEVAE